MATRTSVGSGLWSAAGTWDTGVPLNTDTVIVADGHTVTFDVDQSGFADGVDLTITGTLTCSTAAGDYYLMCSADIDGAGTFNAGSSGTALPSDVTFTIDFNGAANSIEGAGGLTVNFYCTEPTNRYIRLSGAEAIGQTVLGVDTDVTGDIWAAGDVIHINDVNGCDSEERAIAAGGIAAGEITVTVGLTAAKIENALVILINRNIRVTGSTGYAFQYCDDSHIGCEVSGCTNGANACDDTTISAVISGCITYGVRLSVGSILSCIITGGTTYGARYCYNCILPGVFSGCDNGAHDCYNCILPGVFGGCGSGAYDCYNCILSGVFFGGNNGIYACTNMTIDNAVFGRDAAGTLIKNVQRDIGGAAGGVGTNVILASDVQVQSINSMGTIAIENLGYVPDLPVGNGDPGIYHEWQYEGQVETVSADDASRLMTPSSACGATAWSILDAALPRIPASGGDTISVTCTVTLNASQPADSVRLVIDPDGLYGGPEESAQPTPQDTETTLTAELTIDAGSYGAQVPVEVQADDYGAGGEVTIDAATYQLTGYVQMSLDTATWGWPVALALSEPTLTVANDADGDAVTCVVTGDDTATHTIYYRKVGATSWTEGSSDTGDASIAQAGLDNGTFYWFICIASDGDYNSVPSLPVMMYVTDHSVTHTYEVVAVVNPAERNAVMEILATEIDDA